MKDDNETAIFDFDDYVSENLATCKTEKPIAPSVDDLMDFSFADKDEQEEREACTLYGSLLSKLH